MGRLFGTDGARGVAVTELTCETAMQIGRAAASVLCKKAGHRARILIGKDTRISSDIMEAALTAGILSVGGRYKSGSCSYSRSGVPCKSHACRWGSDDIRFAQQHGI